MRVLWFSNTPANAIDYLKDGNLRGGWLQALDKELQDHVDLHIAFFNPNGPQNFIYKNTSYHSIIPKNWKFKRYIKFISGYNVNQSEIINESLKIIEDVKPDLIHVFGSESHHISIVENTHIPVLLSTQGVISSIYKKFAPNFSNFELLTSFSNKGFNRTSMLPVSFLASKIAMKKRAQIEYNVLKKVKYVDGRTDWDRNVMSILCNNPTYFKVDRLLREEFYQSVWAFPIKDAQFRVLTVTNTNTYKGFEIICEALFELKNKIPIHWTIVGINDTDSIVKLTKQKLGSKFPSQNMDLMGKQNAKAIVEKMLESHLYVTASFIENSPNNLAEAMLVGMPCVSTFAGGSNSYITSDEVGILVPEGDPYALAGAIFNLFYNNDLLCSIASNARQSAQIRHNVSNVLNQVLFAYNSILKK
jgi:glycosyltransferase involved in cell wall biosynthesis